MSTITLHSLPDRGSQEKPKGAKRSHKESGGVTNSQDESGDSGGFGRSQPYF